MRRSVILAAAAGLLLASACGSESNGASSPTTTAPGSTPADADGSLLFAFDGDRATVSGDAQQGWTLELTGVGQAMVFTERPDRDAARISMSMLVGDWDELFRSDPPNVAVALAEPDGGETSSVLEVETVSSPDATTVVLTGTELDGDLVAGDYLDPAVFVDKTNYQYYTLDMNVTGLPPTNASAGFDITHGGFTKYGSAPTSGPGDGDDGLLLESDGIPAARAGRGEVRIVPAQEETWLYNVEEDGDALSVNAGSGPEAFDVTVSGVELKSWHHRDHIDVHAFFPNGVTVVVTVSKSGVGSTTTTLVAGEQEIPLPTS